MYTQTNLAFATVAATFSAADCAVLLGVICLNQNFLDACKREDGQGSRATSACLAALDFSALEQRAGSAGGHGYPTAVLDRIEDCRAARVYAESAHRARQRQEPGGHQPTQSHSI